MTTLPSFVPVLSAMTLTCGRRSSRTLTVAVEPSWARAVPSAKLAPTTGTFAGPGPPSVPTISASRAGVSPWLKITTASAPAVAAFCALRAKVHTGAGAGGPPCWIKAMSFAPEKSRPAKSDASQPLVVARGGTRLMSTGMTFPVTLPSALPVNAPVSYVALTGVSCRSSAPANS
jgi:hypothetical protein